MRSFVMAAKWLQLCCVAAFLLLGLPAFAQPTAEVSRGASLQREATDLLNSGQLLRALEVAEKARNAIVADVGEKHWHSGQSEALLGRIFSGLGHAASAVASFQRAVDNFQRHDDRREMLVNALRGLAGSFMDQGRYADASAVYQRALPLAERVAGSKSAPNYVLMVAEQGELLFYMGDYSGAEQRWTEALALAETDTGNEAAIVHSLLGIGSLRLRQDRIGDAEASTLRAHELVIASLGPNHPRVATSLAQLGEIRRRQGRLQQARTDIENALSVATATGGHWSINVARHYAALSSVALAARDPSMALEYQLRSIGILKTVLGENSPELAVPMQKLASLLEMNGKLKEAAAFKSRAMRFPNWQEFDLPIVFGTDRRLNPDTTFGATEGPLIVGVATARALKSEVANRADRIANAMGRLDKPAGRQTIETAISIPHSQANLQGTGLVGSEARRHLMHAYRFPRQVLVYVHGYNNSFDDAVRRAAMIAFDLDFDGVAAVFAWPARGSASGYFGDRVQARKSAAKFAEFLEQMRAEVPTARLHIIAHSTGAEVALGGIEILAQSQSLEAWKGRLGEVIVAHGDIAAADLTQKARNVARLSSMVTSYSSTDDWAIWASSKLRFNQHRAGARPVSATGIQAIDVTGLGGVFGTNHAVFVSNPIVFSDIARLLSTGVRDPSQRTTSFARIESAKGTSWAFRSRLAPTEQ